MTSRILRSEFAHLRSRLPTLWSKSSFVAGMGRVSEATIRRYIEEQSTSPRRERKCRHVQRANRDGTVFRCLECGFTAHADTFGACNIKGAGLALLAAQEQSDVA